jgi:hypothetical protein
MFLRHFKKLPRSFPIPKNASNPCQLPLGVDDLTREISFLIFVFEVESVQSD